MGSRTRATFQKRQKEQARQEKQRAKLQRKLQRKLDTQGRMPGEDEVTGDTKASSASPAELPSEENTGKGTSPEV